MARRRFLAPEVVQTSAMDCGPAALACLLGGFGTDVSYGRLREACQTDVDGTSIDTLEDAARLLGLDADQVMMPIDHLLLDEAGALPALVVTRLPNNMTHFVVAWRRHGLLVQVMDPALGRRWVPAGRFLHDIHVHQFSVAAESLRAWAGSDAFLQPLRRSLAHLHVPGATAAMLVETAEADFGWESLAALDAAARMTRSLTDAGGVVRGAEAAALIERLAAPAGRTTIPETYWFARPGTTKGEAKVAIRGAVLVRVRGRLPDPVSKQELPLELRAALEEPHSQPARQLIGLLLADGALRPAALLVGAALAGVGTVGEALLLRGLISAPEGSGYGGTVAVLLGVAAALLLLEACLASAALGLGGRVEGQLRARLFRRLPRLPDLYFRSRPVSDLSERAHLLHRLRQLPTLGVELVRAAAEAAAVTVGIVWLDPASAVPAVVGATVAVGAGLAMQPPLAERDLRLRSHSGATARFYLEGLLGLVAIRAHSAEQVVEGEHARLLDEWAGAARDRARTVLTAGAVQAVLAVGAAAWLVAAARGRGATPATFLLLAYWALSLPAVGERIGVLARGYPSYRNTTLRYLEPLSSPEEPTPGEDLAPVESAHGAEICFEDVSVRAGGRTILEGLDLHIPPGGRVAVVGPSGAGKSSLVGLLLGWHRPAHGKLLVDHRPLDVDALARLRRHTAWADPSVSIWNRSLAANITYGATATSAEIAAAIADADLSPVVARLPAGLKEPLGEGGGLLSGGESQRVRLARARLRSGVRLAVLDEPFRGLDRSERRTLLSRCLTWWPGATFLLVTHDVGDTVGFERVLVLEGGRVVEDGSPPELAARPSSRYRALLDAEAQAATTLDGPAWRKLRIEDGRILAAEARR